jgi:hypothetical protein
MRPIFLVVVVVVTSLAIVAAKADDPPAAAAVPKFDFVSAAGKYTLLSRESDKPFQPYHVDLLKWSNPIRGTAAGSVFLWTREGIPQAACCMYAYRDGEGGYAVDHELVSLTTEPIEARYDGQPVWETQKPGVAWQPLPDAPAPAAKRPARLIQMRAQVTSLTAHLGTPAAKKQELRLLPQPIYRYPEAADTDGGVFAFVHTTDPEILLLLRANLKDGESKWEFAAARMTIVHCLISMNDRVIWSVPWFQKNKDSTYVTRARVPWTAVAE